METASSTSAHTTADITANTIGVFDSGLGGLTVLRALRNDFPHVDFVYLGDTARVPYGPRSPETIRRYSMECARFLLLQGCDRLVVACNTASAHALDALRDALEVPVSGVIGPSATAAVATARERVLVLATRGTCSSGAYPAAIRALAPGMRVDSIACPLFVALAEEGLARGPVANAAIEHYLHPHKANPPDCVLLGCTHFPLFRQALEDYWGVPCVESGPATARDLAGAMPPSAADREGSLEVFLTDLNEGYPGPAARFLGAPAPAPTLIGPEALGDSD